MKKWGQKNVRPHQFSRQQDYKDKMINSMYGLLNNKIIVTT